MTNLNPIEKAVLPLKQEAIDRATQEAQEQIEKAKKIMSDNENNLEVVAPYPNSFRESRESYREKTARRAFFQALFDFDNEKTKGLQKAAGKIPGSMNTGFHMVKPSEEKEARFIKDAQENAAAQYDGFVNKLNEKIGETKSANLTGSHVWGFSFLQVETKDGESQIWKTQMIINVSKYGRLFNQFPTRKVKKMK